MRVLYQRDGRIARITLNRPEALNAIDAELPGELEDAVRHAQPGTYLEPFALRTLGLVRGDPTLVAQALQRFEAMGLDWHAAKTRELAAE